MGFMEDLKRSVDSIADDIRLRIYGYEVALKRLSKVRGMIDGCKSHAELKEIAPEIFSTIAEIKAMGKDIETQRYKIMDE
jgi:hypothetical protein